MTQHPPASTLPRPRRRLGVVLAALASAGLYALLPGIAAGITQSEPTFVGEVFPWVRTVTKAALVALADGGSHPGASWRFLTLCTGLFAVYAFALRAVKGVQPRAVEAAIFGAGALFLVVLLCAPVMLSTDIYAYAIYGRVFAIYGANPYAATAPITSADPFMPLFGIEYLSSWYGPLWTLISAGLAWLGGNHVGLTALLFRGLAVGAVLAAAALLWSVLRRTAPERAAQGLLLFLWNPLLVLETGLSGHNDAIMLALVLLGVWLHLRGWKVGAVVVLALSVLVKFLTGPVLALYGLMVLRQLGSWRERFVFLAKSTLFAGGGALAVAVAAGVNVGDDVPAAQSATSVDFYANNFHELIFKRLRLALGEDPDLVRQPIYFQSWWVATKGAAELPDGTPLLVIAPHLTDRVLTYDPATGAKHRVPQEALGEIERPRSQAKTADAFRFEQPPMSRPTVLVANRIVRIVTWTIFAAFGLFAAWRTRDLESFCIWSCAAMLASYFLIITEIWPWYVNWAVALGALVPGSRPARLAVLLSAGVLTLYATIGYQGSEPAWIYALRSLPAFIAPLLLWLLSGVPRLLRSRAP
ncbi:MAG: glycosyltransferase 87 family protein [Chthoniobacter sp.]|nr:glycosyltransferase 87 family protein [Chthoniobacter sp.]